MSIGGPHDVLPPHEPTGTQFSAVVHEARISPLPGSPVPAPDPLLSVCPGASYRAPARRWEGSYQSSTPGSSVSRWPRSRSA